MHDDSPPTPEAATASAPYLRWWGRHVVPEESCIRVALGPLTLNAHNLPQEWRLVWRTDGDPTVDALGVTL